MHRSGQSRQQRLAPQSQPHRLGRQAPAATADEQGAGRIAPRHLRSAGQPGAQGLERRAADRDSAPLAALAQDPHLGLGQVHPAARGGGGYQVEVHQFGHPQAAPIEQFGHAAVSGRQRRGIALRPFSALDQAQGLLHRQGLGQGLGGLGRAHTLHRVEAHRPFPAKPTVEAPPARQHQSHAAGASPLRAPLGQPLANVGIAHGIQPQTRLSASVPQVPQVQRVQVLRARCQALFHSHVGQVALHPEVVSQVLGHGVVPGAGRQRGSKGDSAADASSPMRSRNSVPMSAVKRRGS